MVLQYTIIRPWGLPLLCLLMVPSARQRKASSSLVAVEFGSIMGLLSFAVRADATLFFYKCCSAWHVPPALGTPLAVADILEAPECVGASPINFLICNFPLRMDWAFPSSNQPVAVSWGDKTLLRQQKRRHVTNCNDKFALGNLSSSQMNSLPTALVSCCSKTPYLNPQKNSGDRKTL